MAVGTQNFKLTFVPFKPIKQSIIDKEKTQHEIALDNFHDWLKGCKKINVTDKDHNHIRTEFHFPDEIIIKNKRIIKHT